MFREFHFIESHALDQILRCLDVRVRHDDQFDFTLVFECAQPLALLVDQVGSHLDRNLRDRFADNPYYDACAEFCEKYDQAAFDPDYDSESLEFFEPMVRRVLAKPLASMYVSDEEAA